jgi:hypothetical protein
MENTIKIGRQEINKTVFLEAIQKSKSCRDVCKYIGWGTAHSTIMKMGEAMRTNNIDTSHFSYQPERKINHKPMTAYNIADINKLYFNYLENDMNITEESYKTYRYIFGSLLEQIGNKDFVTISKEQIVKHAEGKKMRETVIKAMLKHVVIMDINNAASTASRDMLLYLIDDEKISR